MSTCSCCGADLGPESWELEDALVIPPEPEVGTWVKDRFGATHQRGQGGSWGTPGFYYFGKWADMWKGRGPLVECGPWGKEL